MASCAVMPFASGAAPARHRFWDTNLSRRAPTLSPRRLWITMRARNEHLSSVSH